MSFPFLPLLLFIFILLPFNVVLAQQTKSIVTVGDSLSAGNGYSTWLLSPSGDFSFGFHPLDDINNYNDLFLLSIWYAKIPDKTIAWYANGDKPAPKGSKVQLTSDRGLVLTTPNGTELWKSQVIHNNISGVAFASLNDTGNLVLQDQKFKVVWETFKDPRDTLLPTQILEKGGKFFSRRFGTDFSRGRYQIFLQQDGNLVFYSVNLPYGYANENYFESGTVVSKSSNAGRLLVFEPSGALYVLKDDNERFSLSPSGKATSSNDISTRSFYLRATLNFDGVFSLYKYPKNDQKQSWIPVWSQPENICTSSLVSAGSGVCGYNSICELNDLQRPICHCPKGYSLINQNDTFGSCKPDFTQGCEEDRKLHDFEVLINTDWPLSDYVLQRPFTEEECKQSCLEDCFCSVAVFRLGDSCWKKKIPLSNGRVDENLNNSKAFIKVKKNN